MNKDIAVKSVRSWVEMGLTIPEGLQQALDVDEVLKAAPKQESQPDFTKLTAKNVEKELEKLTYALALKNAQPEALGQFNHAVSSRVLQEARKAVPDLVNQVRERFDAAVESYTEHAIMLPENLDSDALVKAGSEALSRYEALKQSAAVISSCQSWISGLRNVGISSNHAQGRDGVVLAIIKPRNRSELSALVNAPANQTLKAINSTAYAATHKAAEFKLQLPHEVDELIESWNKADKDKRKDQMKGPAFVGGSRF